MPKLTDFIGAIVLSSFHNGTRCASNLYNEQELRVALPYERGVFDGSANSYDELARQPLGCASAEVGPLRTYELAAAGSQHDRGISRSLARANFAGSLFAHLHPEDATSGFMRTETLKATNMEPKFNLFSTF